MGTLLYGSRASKRGTDSVGPEADVWGLGVLYEMLTGQLPFKVRANSTRFPTY